MPQIPGWPREKHHRLDDDTVREELDDRGRAEIAAWRHTETKTKLAHVYVENREKQYLVELDHDEINLDEEGWYSTREEGGKANKRLMRNNRYLP